MSIACDPACVPPEECVDGVCACPSNQACGEICCFEEPECFGDYCFCGENPNPGLNPCSCPADDFLCDPGDATQCCLDSDFCDADDLCVTDTCSADNEFCRLEWAFCNDSDSCGCFVTRDGANPVCADISGFSGCQDVSECATDAECGGTDVCVDVTCCDPESPGIGVCLPVCAAAPSSGQSRRGTRSGASRKRALLRDWG